MSDPTQITIEVCEPTLIVPDICIHKLGKLQKECVTVKLTSEEYAYCDSASQNFWANTKKGAYGKGILNSNEDKTKTERTGLLGEMAFAKITGLAVNFDYKEGGEDHDFVCDAGTIDVKTAAKLTRYKSMLIYAKSGSGKEIPLTSDYYVSAFVSHENREEKQATVIIVGYATQETVTNKELAQSKVGFHYNKEIPYKELENIETLINIIGDKNEQTT